MNETRASLQVLAAPDANEAAAESNLEMQTESTVGAGNGQDPYNVWWRIHVAKTAAAELTLQRLDQTACVQAFEDVEAVKELLMQEGLEIVQVEELAG